MIISRDRHLDDSSLHHVSLVLQTRTREMHSLLSDVSDDVRERIGEVLAQALDQVQGILRPVVEAHGSRGGPGPETSSFGCGT